MKRQAVIFGILALALALAGWLSGIPFAQLLGAGGVALATAPVTLSTQKIVFLTQLKQEYRAIDTWLNEAEDLSAFVDEGQTLRFPEAGAPPAVYKNRTTDVGSVEPLETPHNVELDVYDSENYRLRNINLHALPFDKVQFYTRESAAEIARKEIAEAAYAFAPETAGPKRIVIPTTGSLVAGRRELTLADIVTLAAACDRAEFPEGRNLVLPSDMWWQMINHNEVLRAQVQLGIQAGTITPRVVEYYGFKIHKSLGDKLGIAWNVANSSKAPQGATFSATVRPAALLFCSRQVFRAGGNMEMFYTDKSANPGGRAYEFGFQHRFKADFQMSAQRYSGLIFAPAT